MTNLTIIDEAPPPCTKPLRRARKPHHLDRQHGFPVAARRASDAHHRNAPLAWRFAALGSRPVVGVIFGLIVIAALGTVATPAIGDAVTIAGQVHRAEILGVGEDRGDLMRLEPRDPGEARRIRSPAQARLL